MRLNNRVWTLFAAALGALLCLLVFLAVSASSSGGSVKKTDAAAAITQVSIREKEQEAFSLRVDERGLRGDWRSPEESGSLRVDVSSEGLQIHTQGTSTGSGTADIASAPKRCNCACNH